MGLFGMEYEDWVAQSLPEKVEQSLGWICEYEPEALRIDPRGYYAAISGGKDSQVLKKLFQMAGVKVEFWYNNVTIDPPELVRHLKEHHPDVRWNNPEKHLTRALVDKSCGPPTRIARWCCEKYKEQGGNGRFKAIGVRAEESPRRKATWTFLTSNRRTDDPILCPLIYWTDDDVWQFIREQQIPYCSLYDEGFKRLGCIGCPMGGPESQRKEFERWPGYEKLWRRGFEDYWNRWKGIPRRDGKARWIEKMNTVDDLWNWWTSGKAYEGEGADCQAFLW
jgi:phosphoadenosine phosphosulfate reductase